MTRGTIILILKEKVLTSTEFNGGMYPEGYGDKILKELKEIKTEENFVEYIKKFNKENFGYDEQLIFEMKKNEFNKKKNFSIGYFENWFSDYLFIKNESGKDIIFIMDDKNKYILKNGETTRFYFGGLDDDDKRIVYKNRLNIDNSYNYYSLNEKSLMDKGYEFKEKHLVVWQELEKDDKGEIRKDKFVF